MAKMTFTKNVYSLGTGRFHKKGTLVPRNFPNRDILLKRGLATEEEIEPKAEVKTDYDSFLSRELTDILKSRELPYTGTKEDKIERLEEDDKK